MLASALDLGSVGCGNDVSQSPLEPKLFAQIYAEIVIATVETDSTSSDSVATLRTVLKRHDVSLHEFEQSKQFFEKNPSRWLDVFGHVEVELKKRKSELDQERSLQSEDSKR